MSYQVLVIFDKVLVVEVMLLQCQCRYFHVMFFFQDMFQRVNKAYEFLCSRSKVTEGPDPQNVVLIIKAQSILFSRYKERESVKLNLYKYNEIIILR